jgi:hypothetical protein
VVKVFVTSEGFDGDFGGTQGTGDGQAGGDTACTDAATGLGGNWTAWLGKGSCGACLDARDRIRDGEYQLLDGTVVANDKADLTDGTLDNPINIDENGDPVDAQVWTGTDPDGTGDTGPGTCQVWSTDADTIRGSHGDSSETNGAWTDAVLGGGITCDTLARLYCFADATSN